MKPGGAVVCNAFFDTSFSPNDDLFLRRIKGQRDHLAEIQALDQGQGIPMNVQIVYAKGTVA